MALGARAAMSSRVSIRNDERAADDNDSDSLSAPLSAGSDPISSTAQHGVIRHTKYTVRGIFADLQPLDLEVLGKMHTMYLKH